MHVTYALALYNVDENVDCSGYKRTECPESDWCSADTQISGISGGFTIFRVDSVGLHYAM